MKLPGVFVIGAFGATNFGDDWLEGLLKKQFSNHHLCFLSNQVKPNHIYKWHLVSVFITIIRSKLIVVGPGSLFQALSSKRQNFYYISLIFLAKLCRKQIKVLGLGIEPMPTWITKSVLFSLRGIQDIYVRDQYSSQLLKVNHTPSKQVSDLALLEPLDRVGSIKTNTSLKRLGLCVTALVSSQLDSMIKDLDSMQDFKLAWVGYTSLNDQPIAKQLAKHFNVESILIAYPDWLDRPIDVDALISMRYHVCFWAYLAGIPFISLGKQEKLRDLSRSCKMIHLDRWYKEACHQLVDLCYDKNRSDVLIKRRDALKQICNKVTLSA